MSDSPGVWPVAVSNSNAWSPLVVVCEHASNHIPLNLNNLGISQEVANSHIAWDPGAIGVARGISALMDARLVHGTVSRLVYDCNRPPSASDAMPAKSEVFEVPGNAGLSDDDRAERTAKFYHPFRTALAAAIASVTNSVLITIHSFTPIYLGKTREVEIGILHDSDRRLADQLLAISDRYTDLVVRRNEPYGPKDGVTHTLKEHGLKGGHLNVMVEIRNDLIVTEAQQAAMSEILTAWLSAALGNLDVPLGDRQKTC